MNSIGIEILGLSVRSNNALKRAGVFTIDKLVKLTQDDLYNIRNMGKKSVEEILDVISRINSGELDVLSISSANSNQVINLPLCDDDYLVAHAHNTKALTPNSISYYQDYMTVDDVSVDDMGFSVRSINALKQNSCFKLSDICKLKYKELVSFKNLGKKSIDEIIEKIGKYTKTTDQETHDDKPSVNNCVEYLLSKFSTDEFASELGKIKINIARILVDNENLNDYNANPEGFEIEVIETIMKDDYFVSLFCVHTFNKIKSLDRASLRDFSNIFTNGFVNYTLDTIQTLIDKNRIEYIDGKYEIVYPTFKEYLDSIDKSNRENQFIYLKACGKTLEEIGIENGNISRERVRQIIAKAIKKMPSVREDKYIWLYEKYSLNKEQVIGALGMSSYSFEYYSMRTKKSGAESYLGILEEDVPISMKKSIEAYRYRNYLDVNGVKVEKSRNAILRHILKSKCADGATEQEVAEYYDAFLKENNLEGDEFRYPERYFETKLAKQNDVLNKYGKRLRYYTIDEVDFKNLISKIEFNSYQDVELSTWYFFRHYPEVMEEYDLRDEYELHNLLSKHRELLGRNDVTFNRMPNIGFGNFDRNMQVLNLLIENAPIKATDLALLFEYKYGMKKADSIYFGCISEYLDKGMYSIDYDELSNDERIVLIDILDKDIMLLSYVKNEFIRRLPNADLDKINNYNLKKLGYKISVDLVFNNRFGSFEQLIKNTVLCQDIIDLTNESSLLSNQVFYNLLWENKDKQNIIEFSPKKYINIQKLEELNVDRNALLDFTSKAKEFANGGYFTIHSLKKHGFSHELFELGFDDYFYESVLRYSSQVKSFYAGIGSTYIFNENDNIDIRNMLETIILKNGSMDIYDMIDYLKDEYGIVVEKYKLTEWARESNLYYSDTMEKIYTDYDEFYEEI